MENMKTYLKIKSKDPCTEITKIEIQKFYNQKTAIKHKNNIDKTLLKLSLFELVEKVDIRDIQTFICLTYVYIPKAEGTRTVRLSVNDIETRCLSLKKTD